MSEPSDFPHCEPDTSVETPAAKTSMRPPAPELPETFTRFGQERAKQPEPSKGLKYDGGKLPWHLLAWDVIRLVVMVLAFGAKKYRDRNWERGIAHSRTFAATQRHLYAWWHREDHDDETGLPHLAHAICELMFAAAFDARGMGAVEVELTLEDGKKIEVPLDNRPVL